MLSVKCQRQCKWKLDTHTTVRLKSLRCPVKCNASSGNPSASNDGKGLNLGFTGPGRAGSVSSSGPGTAAPVTADSTNPKKNDSNKQNVMQRLQALGLAGLVSYGIFNTLYYVAAFTIVWFYVAKVPSGQGLQASAKAAVQVLGVTWLGSQATKAARAGGALLLAPLIDRLLEILQDKLRLKSKKQAFFFVIFPACWGLLALMMGSVILLWM